MNSSERIKLPPDLPAPEDDGAADGLEGRAVPAIALESTTGERVNRKSAAEGTLAFRDHARELATRRDGLRVERATPRRAALVRHT